MKKDEATIDNQDLQEASDDELSGLRQALEEQGALLEGQMRRLLDHMKSLHHALGGVAEEQGRRLRLKGSSDAD